MAAPRQRVFYSVGNTPINFGADSPNVAGPSDKSTGASILSDRFWLTVVASCMMLFMIVHTNYHTFPRPLDPKVYSSKGQGSDNTFFEQNARVFLDNLCAYGSRHLGSHANEVLAVKFISDSIRDIQRQANFMHKVEMDIQSPSGCFDIDFLGNFTTCYVSVKNILVKLSSAEEPSSSALLVNCHYDTAISSPGASDDVVSCAIMIETLRAMSQSNQALKHSIVFNFNGAEESILQASHGFITQHRWAKELKAFVNLEAAGSGGREMVFQTGPDHPWLVAAYAQSAKYPFASVVGQEIFQSGVIPSDTDFRIYRDYGNIPGIDIAYTYNGYIYHTIYDQPKYIPAGCIQRGGDNLLSILTNLASSDKLADAGDSRLGKMIFFDLLGFYMVHYPLRLGEIINCMVIVAVLINLYRKLKVFRREGRSSDLYMKLIAASYSMHAVGFVTMVIVNCGIALVVDQLQPMMWFTNNWLVVPVYILPAIATWILVHQHGKHFYSRIFQLVSIWELESIFFEAALIFWTMLLAVLTLYSIGSAYVCMLLVVFPLVIRQISLDLFNINMYSSPKLYISLTALGLLVPFVHLMQFTHMTNIFFMPLMGRVGSDAIPDLVISLLSLLPVIIISTYLAGFLHVSKDMTVLAFKFAVIAVIFTLIGCFSSIGFPYSANPASPSAQRNVFHHYWREFYSYDGSLEKADHGLAYLPFDHNSKSHLEHIPEIKALKLLPKDHDAAYVGFPYYFPLVNFLSKVYTGPMERPDITSKVAVKHKKEQTGSDTIRYSFTISAQAVYINIYMAPANNATLSSWSFTSGTPTPTAVPADVTRSHYFVYTTSAATPHPNRKFWVDVKVPQGSNLQGHWLDIGVGAHYLDGEDSTTPQLKQLLAKLPNWTVPIAWTVTLQHYKL